MNWALRSIGKRIGNGLHAAALTLSQTAGRLADKTARWIGKDAIRELTKPKTLRSVGEESRRKP